MHIPVLLKPVLSYLKPQPGETYLDLTAGYGGHASEVLALTGNPQGITLVDRDPNAVKVLTEKFARHGSTIIDKDFYSASRELQAAGETFDMILADLGLSSPHLDQAGRGFAINAEGPLDMRMDQRQTLTAADVVNSYPPDKLADILSRYGEEPKARAVANAIVTSRKQGKIQTTTELAHIVAKVWPGHSKVHPATRTFQAIRIAVNDELQLVERSLPLWIDLLKPNGRLAVISFHSLEDRLVKQAFGEAGGDRYDAAVTILTKRPVTAATDELETNPRARSAKLRAVVKR